MNGEEMNRLIADDEGRVLLLRFPKGWGLWMDLGGALLYELLRSDLFFFEMNQEFWQEGEGWLKYPLPRSGCCSNLGADYPPPGKIPPQGRTLRGKLRPPLWGLRLGEALGKTLGADYPDPPRGGLFGAGGERR